MISLLAQNEGKTLEFKENAKPLNGIIKTAIAFANTAGGTLIIGVRDKTRELIGLSDILQEEERLTSAMADSIAPLLMPDIEIHSIQGKELLIIQVPHAPGPYYLKSEGIDRGVYVRFGSTNRIADAEMLSSLRLLATNLCYDELPHIHGKIDFELVKKVFGKINKRPTEHSYGNLGIITRTCGQFCATNGGVLLFGFNRLQLFPDSLIRCARFKGTNKERILDQTDIEVPLPYAVNAMMAFVERNVRKEAKFGKAQREDILEYPPFAIREAATNAILHADYTAKGSHIQVAIFDDRIEFTNPGGLPFGLTLEKAISGSSKLRNRVIGRVFRELKLIEQWGSGLRRILGACKRQGLKTPIFEELGTQFRLTLYSTQVEEIVVAPWIESVLKYLKQEGRVTTQEAAKLWKVSTRTARTRLKSLQEDGFIFRLGTSETDPTVVYISTRKD